MLILNVEKQKDSLIEKPLKIFGLLSYSLYIWHYPILSFSERISSNDNIYFKACLFVFIMIVSYLSYFLIEKKLKKNVKVSFYFIFICLFFSSVIVFFILKNNGYRDRLNLSDFYENTQKDISISTSQNEEIFQDNLNKNVLIIGNSHSIQSYQGFIINKKKYEEFNFKNFHIQIKCFNESILINKKDPCKGILDFNEKEKFSRGVVNFKKSNIVILSTRWNEDDLKELPKVINFLRKNNKKIIIFNSIVDMSNNTSGKIISNNLSLVQQNFLEKIFPFQKFIYLNSKYPSIQDLKLMEKEYYQNLSEQMKVINQKLKIISFENNVTFFDLNGYICDNKLKKCIINTDTNKHIIYDTTGHLTMNGAKFLYSIIYDDLIRVLKK